MVCYLKLEERENSYPQHPTEAAKKKMVDGYGVKELCIILEKPSIFWVYTTLDILLEGAISPPQISYYKLSRCSDWSPNLIICRHWTSTLNFPLVLSLPYCPSAKHKGYSNRPSEPQCSFEWLGSTWTYLGLQCICGMDSMISKIPWSGHWQTFSSFGLSAWGLCLNYNMAKKETLTMVM